MISFAHSLISGLVMVAFVTTIFVMLLAAA